MPVRRLFPAGRPPLIVNGLLGLAVLAAAAWGYLTFSPAQQTAAAGVRSIPVSRGTVTASVTAAGSVESAVTAAPSFATSGVVTEIDVKVGDLVKKGAVLARVDDAAARRQLTAARSDLTAARDALDRASAAGGSTTSAQAQVTQAELDVETAQQAVDGTVLTAPLAGTVVAVNGAVGSSSGSSGSGTSTGSSGSSGGGSSGGGSSGTGSAGSSGTGSSSGGSSGGFIRIEDLTRLQVSAAFAEADATRLKPGLAATVSWNALPGTSVGGKVVSIDPNATTTNGVVTYGVLISLDQVPDGARPGQTVQATVTVGTAEDVVVVNAVAVTGTGNRHTVTVLQDGRQVVRQVQVGLQGDQLDEITSGLQEGDQVVLPTGGTTTTGTTGGRNIPGGGGFPGAGGPGAGGLTGGGRRG